jgi:hypothetical protein
VHPSICLSAVKPYDFLESKQFFGKFCVLCHEVQLLQSCYVYVYGYDTFTASDLLNFNCHDQNNGLVDM